MSSSSINFDPDTFAINSRLAEGWHELQLLSEARQQGSAVRFRVGEPETFSPYDFITEEFVINKLSLPERSETIYWLLRCFLETRAGNPVIKTDRGRKIYIELSGAEKTISLYVGVAESVFCVGQEDENTIYSMEVQEKCEFRWCPSSQSALKRKFSARELQELSGRQPAGPENDCPVLFYTIGRQSACLFLSDRHQCMSARALLIGWHGNMGNRPSDPPCQARLTSGLQTPGLLPEDDCLSDLFSERGPAGRNLSSAAWGL
jgi:hypothetical protein